VGGGRGQPSKLGEGSGSSHPKEGKRKEVAGKKEEKVPLKHMKRQSTTTSLIQELETPVPSSPSGDKIMNAPANSPHSSAPPKPVVLGDFLRQTLNEVAERGSSSLPTPPTGPLGAFAKVA
jgi:hypothetical protein